VGSSAPLAAIGPDTGAAITLIAHAGAVRMPLARGSRLSDNPLPEPFSRVAKMRRLLLTLLTLAAVAGVGRSVSAQTTGVVLMHGNTDSPDGTISLLAAAIKGAGYLVETPEMCWSHRRRRDRPFLDCLAELEAPIARLSSRGARAIVVAGMSQGGLGALVFGARRSGLAGVIALAPNGAPERLVGLFPQISESVARVRAMVAEGGGDERASFTDLNIRGPFSIETTPAIYLSFFDPAGPANMLDNTLSQGRGSCDGSGRLRSYVRPLWRGRMTAGPDGLRGSGPKKKSDV